MPVVDDSTGEPMTDDPGQVEPEAAGGKVEGDAGMQGASETGGGNVAEEKE